jgi:hypothetical protein
MDLHLANAQTHILTALFHNNNTILSTVPRSTTANPDSPHQAPLSHRLPNIPTAIFNNTSNNTNNNSSGNTVPLTFGTSSTLPTNRKHLLPATPDPTFYNLPRLQLSNEPALVVRLYDAVTQCHLP